jgi:integrase
MDFSIMFSTTRMPSVFRKPNSRFWFASFKDDQGTWRSKSTKTENKTFARKVADTFQRVAQRKLTAARVAEAIRDLYGEITGEDAPRASVRGFCQSWLKNKGKERLSPATLVAYRDSVGQFLNSLGPKSDKDISTLAKSDLVAFRDSLSDRLSPETTNKHLKILKMVLRAAKQDGFMLENPAEGLKTLDTEGARLRRPFSLDELRAILRVSNEEWSSLVKLGLYTGQRLGDLASLTWANVRLDEGCIRFRTRKTGIKIDIPITGALREHLLSLPSVDRFDLPLHPRSFATMQEQRGRTNTLSNQFAEILAAAGLRDRKSHQSVGKGRAASRENNALSFHCLRHTAVSLLKRAGVPDATVQELIGHESAAISARYTHVGEDQLAEAIRKFPVL